MKSLAIIASIALAVSILFLFPSCEKNKTPTKAPPPAKVEPVAPTPPIIEVEPVAEKADEPAIEIEKESESEKASEPEPAPEPAPEPKKESEPPKIVVIVEDEEFNRSTSEVDVTKETFSADKAAILEMIDKMIPIMESANFNEWVKCVDQKSRSYWSNRVNLTAASKRLPNKQVKLRNLNDYFKYVFIPSRKGRKVEEIRYVTTDNIKAVQIKPNANDSKEIQDVVYYNFVKINGEWLIRLPPLK